MCAVLRYGEREQRRRRKIIRVQYTILMHLSYDLVKQMNYDFLSNILSFTTIKTII